MTVLEYAPTDDEILDFVNQSIQQLQDGGTEARYLLVGTRAYHRLRKAIGRAFQRGAGQFETYQFIPIVVDPFREDEVCVLPASSEVGAGVSAHRLPPPSGSG